MRKATIFLGALALLAAEINSVSAAGTSPKPGTQCLKLGSSTVAGSLKLTCVKVKNKLVWSSGQKISAVQPSASPTNSTSSNTNATAPESFTELIGKISGIPNAAWQSMNIRLANSSGGAASANIFVGPNSRSLNPNVQGSIDKGFAIHSNFPRPHSIDLVYYSFQDLEWARNKIAQLGFPNRVQEVSGACSSADNCNGASAGRVSDTMGFGQFAIPMANSQDYYHSNGAIEIHEYTHMVQSMQFVGKSTLAKNFSLLPAWFLEGHAHAIGNLGAANSLADYLEYRSQWLHPMPNATLRGFTASDITKFYDSLMPGMNNSDLYGFTYTLGFLTIEQLIALKGVDSPMQLVVEVSNGLSFGDAFKKVFGIDWNDAEPILAQVVAKEVA